MAYMGENVFRNVWLLHDVHLLSFWLVNASDIIRDFSSYAISRFLRVKLTLIYVRVFMEGLAETTRGGVTAYNSCLARKLNKLETCCRARPFARCRGTRTRPDDPRTMWLLIPESITS